MMLVIILGGIMSGIFTSTEAGAVGLLYGLLIGLLTKELPLKDIPGVLVHYCNFSGTWVVVDDCPPSASLGCIFGWTDFQQYTHHLYHFGYASNYGMFLSGHRHDYNYDPSLYSHCPAVWY